jgi:hypothetical protein
MTTLWVGSVPGRKHKALYSNSGQVSRVLAYFRSDEAAETFMAWCREYNLVVDE